MYIIKRAKISTTWETLAKASEDGKLSKILSDGDMIPVTLNDGSDHRIIFTHDDNNVPMFLFDNCVAKHQMNTQFTNEGGWDKSEMRDWLNNEFVKNLPRELKEVIQPTKITQIINGKKVTTSDVIWLPSECQVHGKSIYAGIELNDAQIKWFRTLQHRVKTYGGSASHWWLRSPSSGYGNTFCIVPSDGSATDSYAPSSYGVSPGFVI